ncbi:trypsin inhibitor ClTI-1-like [Lampris incognitus]|uniref:trypsin inhibitor ClTI-1-like n=1 Tax=Lampris incognitus TaxID=2546036 RepID=UPI0024B54E23|nr:trypsin inhibitor ClTI-1-like [Lampris incognitus]
MWRETPFVFAAGLLCFVVWARGAQIPDGSVEPDCGQYPLPACVRSFEPVCGTDGETYSNECMLCVSNSDMKVHVRIKSRTEC